MNKGQSGRPHSSAKNENVAALQVFAQSSKKCVRQYFQGAAVPKNSICITLQHEQWK
jgi:hypothetical protein